MGKSNHLDLINTMYALHYSDFQLSRPTQKQPSGTTLIVVRTSFSQTMYLVLMISHRQVVQPEMHIVYIFLRFDPPTNSIVTDHPTVAVLDLTYPK